MPCSIRYGLASTLQLPIERDGLTGCYLAETPPPLDVRAAVRAALDEPIEFPPLSQAVVAGDRVAIVVDRYVPHAAEVVSGIVERLAECGIGPEAVTLLFPDAESAAVAKRVQAVQPVTAGGKADAKAAAVAKGPTLPHVEIHNPDDRDRLSFLGNTASGKPIYVNRTIGEADLVIPVGATRGRVSWSYRGPLGAIYPLFSDRDTHKRYRNPHLFRSVGDRSERAQIEVDAVGWQSGAQFTVQIVPGSGDDVLTVVAGELKAVRRQAESLFNARHQHTPAAKAQVVVAAVNGAEAQTWEQFAVALHAALAVADEGAAVAIVSDLQEPVQPALEVLTRCGEDRDDVLTMIRKERPIDLFPALQLIEAQRRVRIYLLSKLDTTTVEDLGMTPITDPDDIGRLAQRRGSCIVIGDAQYADLGEYEE